MSEDLPGVHKSTLLVKTKDIHQKILFVIHIVHRTVAVKTKRGRPH